MEHLRSRLQAKLEEEAGNWGGRVIGPSQCSILVHILATCGPMDPGVAVESIGVNVPERIKPLIKTCKT